MIAALHHVGMTVSDLERAATFLHNLFGFASAGTLLTGTLIRGRAVMLRAPNCFLELVESAAAVARERPVNESGITHISIQSRHIDALYERALAAAARPHAPPIALGTGFVYLYLRDSEHNVIEIEGVPFAPAQQSPWVAHVAIATHDLDRLATFYHGILGGERRNGAKIGPNPLVDRLAALSDVEAAPVWVVGRNVTLELWQYLNPPTTPAPRPRALDEAGYSHICFEVRDITESLAAFQRAGATVVTPVAVGAGATTALVRDPDGNLLELAAFSDAARAAGSLADIAIIQRMEALRQSNST